MGAGGDRCRHVVNSDPFDESNSPVKPDDDAERVACMYRHSDGYLRTVLRNLVQLNYDLVMDESPSARTESRICTALRTGVSQNHGKFRIYFDFPGRVVPDHDDYADRVESGDFRHRVRAVLSDAVRQPVCPVSLIRRAVAGADGT